VTAVGRRPGGRERRRPAITAPRGLAIRRPRDGWVAGLLGAGVVVVLRLVAVAVALAALAGITAVLWQAGQGRVPLVVLFYGFVAVAWGGFALGRSGRLLTWSSGPPERPAGRPWEAREDRVQTGLIWEQDDLPVTQPAGQDELPFTWRAELEDSP
jgi:hypothetical protein